MQGWVDLGGSYNYQDSLPARRRSPVSEINNQAVSRLGGELSTLESWVRRPNHSTAEPALVIQIKHSWYKDTAHILKLILKLSAGWWLSTELGQCKVKNVMLVAEDGM